MWILPNNLPLSSVYVPGCAESKEELNELESHLVSSLMWKSKPSSFKTWSLKWKRVYWFPHLCGRILKPFQWKDFETKYTESLEDIRVSHSHKPDAGGGVDDPRHLWPYIKEMVRTITPDWCFFENVAGHLTLGFDIVKRELEELHYRVEAGIFSAQEVGAPHRRERLFILAVRNGVNLVDSSRGRTGGIQIEAGEGKGHGTTRTSGILGGEAMDNSASDRPESEHSIQAGRNSAVDASEELANSESGRCGGRPDKDRGDGVGIPKSKGQERSMVRSETQGCRGDSPGETELAKPSSAGHEKRERPESLCGQGATSYGSTSERSIAQRWPSRPGQAQHEWEHPRTESRLGFTVNGYNYREDLLRMAGNGVVEQTAELAWKTLWAKQLT